MIESFETEKAIEQFRDSKCKFYLPYQYKKGEHNVFKMEFEIGSI